MVSHVYSSEDAHKDVQALLVEHTKNPESDAELKNRLPEIVSTFGTNKSVVEITEDLKRHQHSTDTAGMVLIIDYDVLMHCFTQSPPCHDFLRTAIVCFNQQIG